MLRPILPTPNAPQALAQHVAGNAGTAAPASAPSETRLRRSCDACANAKVKCAKQHPRCQRCAAQQLHCVYGPSRKQIKPVSESTHTYPPDALHFSQHAAATVNISPLLSQPPFGSALDPTHSATDIETNLPSIFDDLFDPPPSTLPEQRLDTALFYNPTQSQIGLSPTLVDQLHQWSAHDPTAIQPEHPPIAPLEPALPATHQFDHTTTPASRASTSSSRQSPPEREESESRDCLAQACAALQMLNWSPDDGLAESNDATNKDNDPCSGQTPRLPGILHSTAPSFRRLLKMNKLALNAVSTILRCHCTSDIHMVLLCASIVGRVMRWYQWMWSLCCSSYTTAAAEATSYLSSSSGERRRAARSNTPVTSATQSTLMPIQLDDFDLDTDDSETIIRQLVLNGLKKIAQLTEMFAVMGPDHSEPAHKQIKSLTPVIQQWIKAEVRAMIGTITKSNSLGVLEWAC